MEDLCKAALHYAEIGLAVFPVKERDKVPATLHGVKEATTDPERIKRWWKRNPNFNIGIATGSVSGIVVIDIDDNEIKGKHGKDTLRQWEAQHGDLPLTWQSLTGGGGVHYIYKTSEHFSNGVSVLEDIDIRADGGYIVAPPSVHPNGSTYEWDLSADPEETPIAELSGSAYDLMHVRKEHQKAEDLKTDGLVLKGARQGYLMVLVGKMINAGISDAAIEAAVRAENEAVCDPPMSDAELEKEIFPALRREWQRGDYTDSVLPVNDIADAVEDGDQYPDSVNFSTVYKNLPEVAPELIHGVLRQGHKMIISGPSKAGKSFLLMELAVAIAEGMNWLNNPCTKGKVFYVNMEVDGASFFHRFADIYNTGLKLNTGNHPENLEIWNMRGRSASIHTMAPEIIRRVKGKGYLAVIIDPLYKVLEGDENSNSDIALMSRSFDTIAEETGCSVIYAHHFAKGAAGDKAAIDRGSGAGTFARDPDAILTVTQLDTSALSIKKVKKDDKGNELNAWRIEYTLREFGFKEPTDVWFKHPIHLLDNALEDLDVITSETSKRQSKKKSKRKINIDRAVAECEKCDEQGGFTITEFIKVYAQYETAASRNTYDNWLKAAGYYKEDKGNGKANIWRKRPEVSNDD